MIGSHFGFDAGLVNTPNFHDGSVLGIHVWRDQGVLLFLSDGAGDVYRIALEGVERLLASDFRAGNLILDLTIRVGIQIPREYVADLYDRPANRVIDGVVDRVVREDFRLVEIVPSYGCHLVALCERIALRKIGDPNSIFAAM